MKTDDLITLLARQPAALPRPQLRRDWAFASVAGLAMAFALMLLGLGARDDLAAALASPLFWQKGAALALFAGLSGIVAYRSGLPGRELGRVAALRWVLPVWLALGAALLLVGAPAGERWAQFSSPTIVACLTSIPLLSVPAALAMLWVLRRAAPVEPARAARAVGWAAGGIGAFAYAFHCQSDAPGYVLLWYGLALGLTVLIVQATATRWLRW